MLLHWHVKDPGHSAKSAGGRIQLNMHTHLTQRSQRGLTMTVSRHSVGTYQATSSYATRQSSQLAEPQWIDRGIKSGINVRELISTVKKKCAGGE